MSDRKLFASPQDAEAAFYDALERCDLDAMMAVWAEDEEVVCVHPGGPRLVGYATVRDAWQRVFANGRKLRVQIVQQTSITTPLLFERATSKADSIPWSFLAAMVYSRIRQASSVSTPKRSNNSSSIMILIHNII